ncbi:hypothetical protein Tsubulata_028652 [Turnera subulata]|uniref:J domain-containing protein n=1 Tax=Turnera subulata TaxID=218843 RepID=A0A9Q0J708_9ROSI|nr:hypothetical protein Tsubulata_028652 [Turnera subulata]
MNFAAGVDHYSVLGLPSGEEGAKLTATEISRAYNLKALDLHPDNKPGDPNAHADFLKLLHSYEILMNPVARRRFDKSLRWIEQRREAEMMEAEKKRMEAERLKQRLFGKKRMEAERLLKQRMEAEKERMEAAKRMEEAKKRKEEVKQRKEEAIQRMEAAKEEAKQRMEAAKEEAKHRRVEKQRMGAKCRYEAFVREAKRRKQEAEEKKKESEEASREGFDDLLRDKRIEEMANSIMEPTTEIVRDILKRRVNDLYSNNVDAERKKQEAGAPEQERETKPPTSTKIL